MGHAYWGRSQAINWPGVRVAAGYPQETSNLFNDRCASIDRRFTQWGAEFTDQYRQTQSTLEARVDGASDRVEENDAKLARVESAVKTMDGVVTSNQALATKVKDDLETRLREIAVQNMVESLFQLDPTFTV